MAIKILQSLDLSKKALSQSLRLASSEHSQNQNVAPPNSKKEIKNHLKLNKASDEKLILVITSVDSRGLSRNSFFEARQDRNGAGREITPKDESNETFG